MIERQFVKQKLKEFQVEEYIAQNLSRVGHSHTKLQRTPLGEKITIYAYRPGLVVGRKGSNIKKLTNVLKKKFDLENPQIEISEVENPYLDPKIVAEMIANSLERFGTSKFKGVGHKMLTEVMAAGGRGIEILISGKVPSARAKRWRFYQGYLKKCGDSAVEGVLVAYTVAQLKTGTIGIQVRIMPPDIKLPDVIKIKGKEEIAADEKKEEIKVAEQARKEEEKKEKAPKKRAGRKPKKAKAEEKPAKPESEPKAKPGPEPNAEPEEQPEAEAQEEDSGNAEAAEDNGEE